MATRTIYALATAPGRAAVAIVRISGPEALAVARSLGAPTIPDRTMRLARLTDPDSGALLDEALVVAFPEGGSFTGQATVELHLHGSPAVARAVLRRLGADPRLHPAEPGAFTRQALESGRLSLPQVEALADLIDAETEAQRRQALAGLDGALVRTAEVWRARLIEARALIEAEIDFADEDIEPGLSQIVHHQIQQIRASLRAELAASDAAARLREGLTIAFIGPPNAGKSSLVNALAKRDVALVSDLPGTTRDVLEVRAEIGGQLVTLLDTAGLRDEADPLEALGIERARARAATADLRLVVSAPGLPAPDDLVRPGDVRVANKTDLGAAAGLPVSARTGEGLDALLAIIEARVQDLVRDAGLVAHERQRLALIRAADALAVNTGAPPELVAESIRVATLALDSLIGRVDIETVLGSIFARFCIGK